MRLPERLRSRPFLAAAAAGAILGTAIGLSVPIQATAPDPAEVSAWPEALQVAPRFDEARYARVRDANPWGGAEAARGPVMVQWRLAGIIVDPAPTALVYAKDGKRPLRLKVGDALPDGGKLVEITARSIRFTREGCEFERALYSVADQPGTGGCTPP